MHFLLRYINLITLVTLQIKKKKTKYEIWQSTRLILGWPQEFWYKYIYSQKITFLLLKYVSIIWMGYFHFYQSNIFA